MTYPNREATRFLRNKLGVNLNPHVLPGRTTARRFFARVGLIVVVLLALATVAPPVTKHAAEQAADQLGDNHAITQLLEDSAEAAGELLEPAAEAQSSRPPVPDLLVPAELPTQLRGGAHGDGIDYSTDPVAVADGPVYHIPCGNKLGVLAQYIGNGYYMTWYHVVNPTVAHGEFVEAGTRIAGLAQDRDDGLPCDGIWTGAHSHTELVYSPHKIPTAHEIFNTGISISPHTYDVGGWTAEGHGYGACVRHTEGERVCQWGFITHQDEDRTGGSRESRFVVENGSSRLRWAGDELQVRLCGSNIEGEVVRALFSNGERRGARASSNCVYLNTRQSIPAGEAGWAVVVVDRVPTEADYVRGGCAALSSFTRFCDSVPARQGEDARFSGNVSSRIVLNNGRLDLVVTADNLEGNSITATLSRDWAYGSAPRAWTETILATSDTVIFRDLADGRLFRGVRYHTVAAINNSDPHSVSEPSSACYGPANDYAALCDAVVRP